MTATAHAFTSSDALAALNAACSEVGLSSDGAELIRLGENAIFRLPKDPIIVRIARSSDLLPDAAKEVAVASWLHREGIPAAETSEQQQPILANGRPVTFWQLIPDSGDRATVVDLARILRTLHGLSVPSDLPLPKFDIFGRAAQRISATNDITDDEREFLVGRLADLRKAYSELEFSLDPCAIHADAHQSNLMKTPDGEVLLIDFEGFAFGPPEYDLSVTATEQMVGWHTEAQYAEFVRAYGFDVKNWSGFPVVRAINEFKMTTWLMQNVGESDQVAEEFRTRLASLYDDDAPRRWSPF